MKNRLLFTLLVIISVNFFSCQKSNDFIGSAEDFSLSVKPEESSSTANSSNAVNSVYVSNIDELYTEINNPENVGVTLVLLAGIYMLNPNYPNGGRLEFLHDMSITGQAGRPEQVIIDATNLPNSSLRRPIPGVPGNPMTGVVRMGDGKNTLEWLTLQNDPANRTNRIRSLVQTDIVATPVAQIRIAHTIIQGSSIGINLINAQLIAQGRVIKAVLEDNELRDNAIPGFGTAIQIQNSQLASDAAIYVTMRRNYIHRNVAGIVAFNGSTEGAMIEIKSYTDRIEDNRIGMFFNGGYLSTSDPALNNLVRVEAYATTVKNNTGDPSPLFLEPGCGVFAAGAESWLPLPLPGNAHHNQLDISFHGCTIEGNEGDAQIICYGAISYHPVPTLVGTYNTTNIYLYGKSADAVVSATPSVPAEPAGTNTITIYQ